MQAGIRAGAYSARVVVRERVWRLVLARQEFVVWGPGGVIPWAHVCAWRSLNR